MKRKLLKSLSYLLAVMLMMSTIFSSKAFASDGMTIEENTTTTVKTDEESGDTTTTVEKDKNWQEDNLKGEEKSKTVETTDSEGQLISSVGQAQGKETTTIKDEKETQKKNTEEIDIDNGQVQTGDGKKIKTEVPEVTIELEPGKSAEKTEEISACFDEDSLEIPDWIRQKDGETNTWITENSSKEEDGSITNITVDNGENSTTYTRKITKPDGKVTEEKITYTRDQKGGITGYSTESKETVSETTEELTPPENAEIHADGGWKELVYELPEKPVVEEAERDENGKVINGKIVAELHDADGNVAGYTEIEIVDGKIVSYSDPVMGKLISKETNVEILENGLKKYTVTKTRLTKSSGKKATGSLSDGKRTVYGEMGQINGNVLFNYESLKTFLPDFTIVGPSGEGFNDEKDIAKVNSNFLKDYDENGEYFQWLGQIGLFSPIYLKHGDYGAVTADQFEIKGRDGRKYYAYCADLGVYAQEGAKYNMQMLEDVDYIQNKDKLRSIVLKGYWGVKNESEDANNPSTGSFEAFRKMLLDNNALTEEETNKLTDGMALLATQAAIWRYGNSGQFQLGEELQFPWGPGDPKASIINKTYNYLIGMEGTPAAASNTIFNKDDFATKVDLTVKEKLEDDKYNTDVKIAMGVDLDNNDGDLKLFVTADGKTVDEFRLTGAPHDGEKIATKNPDGTYTLSGLHLKEDTKFNINLKGVQNLRNGVYIFSCMHGPDGNPAQTLIGAGESKQNIDLNVDLKFNVKEIVTYTSEKSESEVKTLEWEAYYYTFEETPFHDDVENEKLPDDETETTDKTVDIAEETPENPKKPGDTNDEEQNELPPQTGDTPLTVQIFLLVGSLVALSAFSFPKKSIKNK